MYAFEIKFVLFCSVMKLSRYLIMGM